MWIKHIKNTDGVIYIYIYIYIYHIYILYIYIYIYIVYIKMSEIPDLTYQKNRDVILNKKKITIKITRN